MTRAPAALAIAAVVLCAWRGPAAAQPCPPRAELGGDGAAVARVSEELRRLGVAVEPAAAGCPSVQAMVAVDAGGGIAVAVRGATRGSEGRVVSDATLAAAWIDSWVRDDVDVALWSAPPRPRVASVPTESPAIAPPPVDVEPPVVQPTVSLLDRFALGAGYEQTWTSDGASATGVGGALSVKLGWLAVGGRVHAAYEGLRTVGVTGMARSDLTALATASMALAAGRMTIAPELALGVGRVHTRRVDGCNPDPPPEPPLNCDPMDPTCMEMPPGSKSCVTNPDGTDPNTKVYVGDELDVVSYGPRVAVALRIAVPLFEHVWLDGLASLTFAPFAHAAPFAAELDAPTMTMAPPTEFALPGEPGTSLQLGIGLRIGAR